MREAPLPGVEPGVEFAADFALNRVLRPALDFTVDQLTLGAREAGEAGQRFLNELDELRDLSRVEAFERLNQAILGGFTPEFELSPDGLLRLATANPASLFDWGRALEGLAGNATYRGSDHFLLQQLPERYSEPLGSLLEDAVLVAAIGGAIAGAAASAPISTPVAIAVAAGAVVSIGVSVILTDLGEEDSDVVALLEAARDDAERLFEQLGLDEVTFEDIRMEIEEIVRGGEGLPSPVR